MEIIKLSVVTATVPGVCIRETGVIGRSKNGVLNPFRPQTVTRPSDSDYNRLWRLRLEM